MKKLLFLLSISSSIIHTSVASELIVNTTNHTNNKLFYYEEIMPNDMTKEIFFRLDYHGLKACKQVNKNFHAIFEKFFPEMNITNKALFYYYSLSQINYNLIDNNTDNLKYQENNILDPQIKHYLSVLWHINHFYEPYICLNHITKNKPHFISNYIKKNGPNEYTSFSINQDLIFEKSYNKLSKAFKNEEAYLLFLKNNANKKVITCNNFNDLEALMPLIDEDKNIFIYINKHFSFDSKYIIDSLLQYPNNFFDKLGCSLLSYASSQEHQNTVELLIQNNADINQMDTYGQTAFLHAAQNGCTNVLNILIENGADINKADMYGTTALMHAAQNGYTDVLKILIEKSVDINKADVYGQTALMYAAKYGCTDVLKILIEKSADINKYDLDGKNALMHAAKYEYTDIAELLTNKDSEE